MNTSWHSYAFTRVYLFPGFIDRSGERVAPTRWYFWGEYEAGVKDGANVVLVFWQFSLGGSGVRDLWVRCVVEHRFAVGGLLLRERSLLSTP